MIRWTSEKRNGYPRGSFQPTHQYDPFSFGFSDIDTDYRLPSPNPDPWTMLCPTLVPSDMIVNWTNMPSAILNTSVPKVLTYYPVSPPGPKYSSFMPPSTVCVDGTIWLAEKIQM